MLHHCAESLVKVDPFHITAYAAETESFTSQADRHVYGRSRTAFEMRNLLNRRRESIPHTLIIGECEPATEPSAVRYSEAYDGQVPLSVTWWDVGNRTMLDCPEDSRRFRAIVARMERS